MIFLWDFQTLITVTEKGTLQFVQPHINATIDVKYQIHVMQSSPADHDTVDWYIPIGKIFKSF